MTNRLISAISSAALVIYILPGACSTAAGQFSEKIQASQMSMTVKVVNGVKITSVLENGRNFQVQEDQDGAITVKMTRTYGPSDLDKIQKDHPGLFMSLQAFPQETEQGEKVEISLNILTEKQAASVEVLKSQHPEAYKVYARYILRLGKRAEVTKRFFDGPDPLRNGNPFGADPFEGNPINESEKADDGSDDPGEADDFDI